MIDIGLALSHEVGPIYDEEGIEQEGTDEEGLKALLKTLAGGSEQKSRLLSLRTYNTSLRTNQILEWLSADLDLSQLYHCRVHQLDLAVDNLRDFLASTSLQSLEITTRQILSLDALDEIVTNFASLRSISMIAGHEVYAEDYGVEYEETPQLDTLQFLDALQRLPHLRTVRLPFNMAIPEGNDAETRFLQAVADGPRYPFLTEVTFDTTLVRLSPMYKRYQFLHAILPLFSKNCLFPGISVPLEFSDGSRFQRLPFLEAYKEIRQRIDLIRDPPTVKEPVIVGWRQLGKEEL